VEEKYAVKQDYPVKVVRLTDFGAFVRLEEGIEGLIHVSQLSRNRVEKPADVLEEGQEIEARVLEIKPEERRIRLSISAIEEEQHRRTRGEEKTRKKSETDKQRAQFTDDDQATVTIGDIWDQAVNSNDE
jgi:small subunit ribosomal protein S1